MKKIILMLAACAKFAHASNAQQHICIGECVPQKSSGSGVITLISPIPDTVYQGEDILIQWTSSAKFDNIFVGLKYGPHQGQWIEERSFPDNGEYCWHVKIYTAGFGLAYPRPIKFKIWICGQRKGGESLSNELSQWITLIEK